MAARLEHSNRRKSTKVNVGVPESSSEDGNDSSPDSPLSPPVPPVGGFREETISKEKQKFFRLNSFYGSKGRGLERCKVEGRSVRDISSSSNSSSSDSSNDVDNSKIKPVLSNTPKSSLDNSFSTDKSKLLTSRESVPDKRMKTNAAASSEHVVNEPFGSFGMFGQYVTFEDLAKRYKANNKSVEQLPNYKKPNAKSWLKKFKSADTSNSSRKNNVGRLFSTSKPKIEFANVKHPLKRTVDEKNVVVKNSITAKITGGTNRPSDSWHNLIKPSSSIPSQKSIISHKQLSEPPLPAKTEDQNTEKEEELWGFAAAAARKKVTPVLHLDKEGTAGYPSVFLTGMWNKDPLKNVTNMEAAYAVTGFTNGPIKSDGKFAASQMQRGDGDPNVPDKLPLALSPSKLVKTAVLSKQYEHIRRNMLISNAPFLIVNQLGDVIPSDKETIKKKLIAEATKTRHFQVCRHLNHLSVQPVSVPPSRPYNQSGKRITSYLNKQIPFSFLTPFRFFKISC